MALVAFCAVSACAPPDGPLRLNYKVYTAAQVEATVRGHLVEDVCLNLPEFIARYTCVPLTPEAVRALKEQDHRDEINALTARRIDEAIVDVMITDGPGHVLGHDDDHCATGPGRTFQDEVQRWIDATAVLERLHLRARYDATYRLCRTYINRNLNGVTFLGDPTPREHFNLVLDQLRETRALHRIHHDQRVRVTTERVQRRHVHHQLLRTRVTTEGQLYDNYTINRLRDHETHGTDEPGSVVWNLVDRAYDRAPPAPAAVCTRGLLARRPPEHVGLGSHGQGRSWSPPRRYPALIRGTPTGLVRVQVVSGCTSNSPSFI